MAVLPPDSSGTEASLLHDDLTPWLRKIESSIIDLNSGSITVSDLNQILAGCIHHFKDNLQYQNDARFLKLWSIYLTTSEDFEGVVRELEESNLSPSNSLFYELYALFLESKGWLHEAYRVYNNGILRNAEPIARLRKAQAAFLDRMSYIISTASLPEADGCGIVNQEKDWINPWSTSTKKELSEKINAQLLKYNGYVSSAKPYSGKVDLSSLRKSSRNKVIEIGAKKYLIKGCAGEGGFAQVFKAHIVTNPDDVVALKIQKPAFPWEFYMYRQLDLRISGPRRSSFGYAHKMHVYADCSILICDFLSHGTLQDAINSFYVVPGKSMDEVLCIYYTIEMLYMLEKLHGAGILHGDFKADNLLMRYTSDDLPEDGFTDPNSPRRDQGLCLVDWGRAIDLHLFPDNAEFTGDCRTSGFRCVEMQENKPWKYQVDIYGLCVVVHMMLHGSYMEIQKKSLSDGGYIYQPRTSPKRYWKVVDLWRNLFTKLLNIDNGSYDQTLLSSIRHSFEEYMISNPQLIKKLKDLLVRQRTSLCQA